jgi:hypothetical protein
LVEKMIIFFWAFYTVKLVGAGNATKGLVALQSAENVFAVARTGNDSGQH